MKLLCIGDSLTFGYEIESSKRWTNLLAEELSVEVLNFGINGDTTTGMLSRFNTIISEHLPTHIIIFGGTNDLWFGLKDELIVSNIFAMCRQAKHNNMVPIVGITTPCFNLNELNFVGEDYAECIRSFQNILIDFCNLKDIEYINFGFNLEAIHFMDDGLHINEKGQIVMKENAKDVFLKMKNKK